jgi:regulator of sigma E protease
VTWVIVVAGLVAIVFIHELGHFSVALLLGMRPRSFYIGFPPAVVKTKRRGIEYGIGAIPLGGYVRIPGMHRPAAADLQSLLGPAIAEDPSLSPVEFRVRRALATEDYAAARDAYPELEEAVATATLSAGVRRTAERGLRDVEEGTAPDAYWRASTWKRVAVIAAGPFANVVLAFLILFVAYSVSGAPTGEPTSKVAAISSGSPAEAAGLQAGDRIVAVNGVNATTFAVVSRLIRSSDGAPVRLTVNRAGDRVTLRPERTVRQSDGRWIFGFTPAGGLAREPVDVAATSALSDLKNIVTGTVSGIGGLGTSSGRSQISSIVGIGAVSAQALHIGFVYYLELLALVSMSLGLLNLLPLLPLDGGHILFSLIEGVRKRPLARAVYERVSIIGLALILLLFVIAAQNDAHRYFG